MMRIGFDCRVMNVVAEFAGIQCEGRRWTYELNSCEFSYDGTSDVVGFEFALVRESSDTCV